jgi:nucleotide-binding universal stress UspA family protein
MSDAQDVLVVGSDGSPGSDRALEWALEEARRRRAAVEVVTAFGPVQQRGTLDEPTSARNARQSAERAQAEQLARIAHPYRDRVDVTGEVVAGRAVERLVEASHHASLLVVGSHGNGRLHEVLVGSVAAGCIRAADCPVVVLPAPHLPALEKHELQALGTHQYQPGPMY